MVAEFCENSPPESKWLREYNTINENEIAHHDLTKLPNGNVLTLIWERIPLAQAVSLGASTTSDIFLEKIIEVDPSDNSIVWQWKSWEHIVQDYFFEAKQLRKSAH